MKYNVHKHEHTILDMTLLPMSVQLQTIILYDHTVLVWLGLISAVYSIHIPGTT